MTSMKEQSIKVKIDQTSETISELLNKMGNEIKDICYEEDYDKIILLAQERKRNKTILNINTLEEQIKTDEKNISILKGVEDLERERISEIARINISYRARTDTLNQEYNAYNKERFTQLEKLKSALIPTKQTKEKILKEKKRPFQYPQCKENEIFANCKEVYFRGRKILCDCDSGKITYSWFNEKEECEYKGTTINEIVTKIRRVCDIKGEVNCWIAVNTEDGKFINILRLAWYSKNNIDVEKLKDEMKEKHSILSY